MVQDGTRWKEKTSAFLIKVAVLLLVPAFPNYLPFLSPGLSECAAQSSKGMIQVTRSPEAPDPQSDLNKDGIIDLRDLAIFSERWLKRDWREVDWRNWLEGENKTKRHMGEGLFNYMITLYALEKPKLGGQLGLKNEIEYPTRLAWGPKGRLFVSDIKVGSVFIYETVLDELVPIGELKGLNKPMGIAVDSFGNIYVGNDGLDNIEIYDSLGWKKKQIGQGFIKMPTDLALDDNNVLYVADSVNNTIWVYDRRFKTLKNFGGSGTGNGKFDYPSSVTVHYSDNGSGQMVGELFVADQGNALIQVFDLQGNFLRSFGGFVSQGMMGWKWKGKFVKAQSLQVDDYGRLHACDLYLNNVQILDRETGLFIDSYGPLGPEPDPTQVYMPLDIAINGAGKVAAAEAENKSVEFIYTVP
jgi:hypothetical protein